MKKTDAVLKEYVRGLSDEDLRFLNSRFQQLLCGDRAEIADILFKDKDVDRWLASATSAEDWFDMLDVVGQNVVREAKRRHAILKEQREQREQREQNQGKRDKPFQRKERLPQPAPANVEAS